MKNKHLNEVFEKVNSYKDEPVPYDILRLLLGELVLIKVYCVYEDHDFLLDDNKYVQVFTTHEKFSEYYDDSHLEIYDFEDSILYLNEEDGEGVIINPGSDNISLSVEDVRGFRFNYKEPRAYNRKSNHVPKQLKKLKKINNQRLNRCANKDLADLDELLIEISRAKVFALVKSENDIKAKKGIINRGDDKYYIDDDGFGHIFSSWDKIEKLDDNVYVTVPIPEIYVRYILNNDYEGIILNGDYILSREFLILNINTIISYSHQNDMGDYSNYGLKLYD